MENAPENGCLTRRALAWLCGCMLAILLAAAPVRAADEIAELLARGGLDAKTGYALMDLRTGAVIESHNPDISRPPASVAKVLTALWARETLGPGYRFRTRVWANGKVEDGIVAGDLVLAGSGDPLLTTDALAGLVRDLAAAGIVGVSGRFLVDVGAFPAIERIDAGQPVDAGYNPSVSGLNLNFNRVHLAWEPGTAGPRLSFSARSEAASTPLASFRGELAEVAGLRHRLERDAEVWTLPVAAPSGTASRLLPVRRPWRLAGEAFRALAAEAGIDLPVPIVISGARRGEILAVHESAPLDPVLRGLLQYSTNLTAEAVGLRASQARGARPRGLAGSALAMTGWAEARFGTRSALMVNHSGLSAASSITAREMVTVLAGGDEIADLLRERPILDVSRAAVPMRGVRVLAKTGTLDFVSALAGYLEGRGGRRFAFAIFSADLEARASVPPALRDAPPGAKTFAARARGLQQGLLRRWARVHGGARLPSDPLRPMPRPAAML